MIFSGIIAEECCNVLELPTSQRMTSPNSAGEFPCTIIYMTYFSLSLWGVQQELPGPWFYPACSIRLVPFGCCLDLLWPSEYLLLYCIVKIILCLIFLTFSKENRGLIQVFTFLHDSTVEQHVHVLIKHPVLSLFW